MKYKMLLWPHANVRYQNETLKLAGAELRLMLDRFVEGAKIDPDEKTGMPALDIETSGPIRGDALDAIRMHSLLYGLFELKQDGSLLPLASRLPAWLGHDLPGILKYKGKTNELFLQMLINVAQLSGDYWRGSETLQLLDPMCGRGTSLFIAANRRWDATGMDIDRNDLKEAEKFFKRYLEYHRFKHLADRQSLTLQNARPAPVSRFVFSDTAEHFKQKQVASLKLVNADACRTKEAFGKNAFHLIVCDLPYGVQHAAQGVTGGLEALMAKALPGWKDVLKPGGTVAVSFNAQILKLERVRRLMADAGMEPLCGGAYDRFSHWVEQAVTRDIAVCRKNC